jgi:hypothetical protein
VHWHTFKARCVEGPIKMNVWGQKYVYVNGGQWAELLGKAT